MLWRTDSDRCHRDAGYGDPRSRPSYVPPTQLDIVGTAALAGTLIGVPIGIACGRWPGKIFAHEIFAAPRPAGPTLSIIYVAVGALVLADLAATIPGVQAAGTPPALLFHAE